ncbi:Gfo/Idh/MocA family oxidoreductase [uncultured Sunxiuqinia sp.]|uniref:Gfo/Idh/MocA family protein n=1 Tax=uncultured Sunxiuqinia sp. TaxID=1573825 RepID=UPI002AA7AE21|nr:Gfo/Idh/MocA family oxidoreductase [uncultured Sunxiuqinia sp.]
MTEIYNWAILGCGRIASKFAADLALLPQANLYAAASRTLDRAQHFASKFNFEKAYGSYEELVNDPKVDIVYIATPHSHHYQHALLCLHHKKATLCEKAFAINTREVKEMIACSKANNTFLMEAFWTRFQPSFIKALKIIESKRLGQLKIVRSDFAFNSEKDAAQRLYNSELGGGALLDIGIYPVFASLLTLGKPTQIRTLIQRGFTNCDESILVSFGYSNGAMASLSASFAAYSSTQTEFWFEKGYLRLNKRWFTPTTLTIWEEGRNEELNIPIEQNNGTGYQFEAQHVMQCLDEGKIESNLMPLQKSLDLIEILDRVRADCGIVYPEHDLNSPEENQLLA